MSKNTGKEYELLTKAIFQQLLEQDNVETTRLEHDVVLEGKTTSHQIDVYWVFEAGGVEYHTIVQAKDWTQTVSQSTVMTFKGVMDDLKFNAHGIMVTRCGYQQGAKDYAEGNGIALYELRKARDEDFDGRLKTINLTLNIVEPEFSKLHIDFDMNWVNSRKKELGLSPDEPIEVTGQLGDLILEDETGNPCGTVADVLNQYVEGVSVDTDRDFRHEFNPPLLMNTAHDVLHQVRITAITGHVRGTFESLSRTIDVGDLSRFILKNVLGDKSRLFTKDGEVIK